MACFLSKFILLKSNKRDNYLRYRKEDDASHAFLQFSGDEKAEDDEIQYVKFEVQKSETMEGFVHIRSCYNNKYWVRKSGGGDGSNLSSWIAAEANEAEEDPSKLSCTLFKPVLVDDADVEEFVEHDKPQKIRLVHVDHVGQQECVAPADSDFLSLQRGQVDDDDVFTAYNASSLVVLPDHVAFTNHEGKYGALTTVRGMTYVDFKTTDIGAAGVPIRLSQNTLAQPPRILCQQISYGWWSLPKGSYVVRLTESVNVIAEPFYVTPIRQGGNNIALRHNNSGRLANCGAANGLAHILGCSATSASEDAIFGVQEPVRLREVSDVKYKLDDSRVYKVGQVDKYRDVRRNATSSEQTGSFSVEYTISQTTNWGDSLSVAKRVSASMSASVPFVGVGLGVEVSQESNRTVEFGEEKKEEQTVTFQQSVTMPPGKQVTLLVVATRAQCDVPFTCHVVDTLSNGTVVRYTKNDGLFTGANEFSFTTELLEQDI